MVCLSLLKGVEFGNHSQACESPTPARTTLPLISAFISSEKEAANAAKQSKCSKANAAESSSLCYKRMDTDSVFAFNLFAVCHTLFLFAATIPQNPARSGYCSVYLALQCHMLKAPLMRPQCSISSPGHQMVFYQGRNINGSNSRSEGNRAEKHYELALCYEVFSHEKPSAT